MPIFIDRGAPVFPYVTARYASPEPKELSLTAARYAGSPPHWCIDDLDTKADEQQRALQALLAQLSQLEGKGEQNQ